LIATARPAAAISIFLPYAVSRRTPRPAANIAEPNSATIQAEEPVKGSSPDTLRSGETRPVPTLVACSASTPPGSGFVAAGADPEGPGFEDSAVVSAEVEVVSVWELVVTCSVEVVVTGVVVLLVVVADEVV
jgi:hypothetical protein